MRSIRRKPVPLDAPATPEAILRACEALARTPDAATERRVKTWRQLAEFLAAHGAAALIGVHDVKGSAPREAGARMVVRPDGAFHGTIGGGQLEMKHAEHRRATCSAAGAAEARLVDQALGPDLGQCCGGRVKILIETFNPQHLAQVRRFAAIEEGGRLRSRMPAGRWPRSARDRLRRSATTAGRNGARPTARTAPPCCCSARAMWDAPWCWRWRLCRLRCAGSTAGPMPFPAHIPQNATAIR